MPIDSNIAMGYRGVDIPNPLNAFAQMQQIQNYQQNNALGQMKMDEMRRGVGEHNRLLSTLSKFSPETKIDEQVNQLQRAGFLKQARDLAESHAKASKDAREGEKANVELVQKKIETARDFLSGVNPDAPTTPNTMMQWFKGALADPHIGPLMAQRGLTETALADSIEQALGTPGGMRQLVEGWRLGAEKFANLDKPHYFQENTGDAVTTKSVRGMGGPVNVVSTAPVVMSDYQRGRLAQSASQPAAESDADTIDFLAEGYRQTGQLPPLGMGASAGKMRSQILSRAAQLAMGGGKTASEAAGDVRTAKADTASAASTVKDFSSGVSARRVTANNTAINHLATMEKLASDLNNSDIRVVNAAGNAFAKATGAPAPTSFDAARQLVASEVVKAVVNNGGGVTERQEAEEQFARANSPEQLKAVIGTYKELLAGQLDSLGRQYETGTGRKDFEKKLTPETRKTFESIRGKTATPAVSGATTHPQFPGFSIGK